MVVFDPEDGDNESPAEGLAALLSTVVSAACTTGVESTWLKGAKISTSTTRDTSAFALPLKNPFFILLPERIALIELR
jgi:hypothetical protein